MVRTTRPEKRASSNGVFLHSDFRSAGSSTQGTSASITMMSAGLPARKVPPGNPSSSAEWGGGGAGAQGAAGQPQQLGGAGRHRADQRRPAELAIVHKPQRGRQHGLQ